MIKIVLKTHVDAAYFIVSKNLSKLQLISQKDLMVVKVLKTQLLNLYSNKILKVIAHALT